MLLGRTGKPGRYYKIDRYTVHCQAADGTRFTWHKSAAKRMRQRRARRRVFNSRCPMLTQTNLPDYANKLLAGPTRLTRKPTADDIAAILSEAAVEIANLDSPQNIVACRCRRALAELPRTFCAGEVAISVGCSPLDVILAAESAGASHFTAHGKTFSRLHYEGHRESYPDGWLADVEFSAQPGKLAAALQVEESEVLA